MNSNQNTLKELRTVSFLYDNLREPFPIPVGRIHLLGKGEIESRDNYDDDMLPSLKYCSHKDEILKIVRNATEPLTADYIKQEVGICTETARRALRKLRSEGLVSSRKVETIKKGHPAIFWIAERKVKENENSR
jgi:hypothetical protein